MKRMLRVCINSSSSDATSLSRGGSRCLLPNGDSSLDATSLSRGGSRCQLPNGDFSPDATSLSRGGSRCQLPNGDSSPDATSLSRGGSRFALRSWQREPPRDKLVASVRKAAFVVAADVSLHETSSWHLFRQALPRLLIIICVLAVGSLNSVAQEKTPRPDESKPQKPGQVELKVPTDGTFKVLAPKVAIGKVVKGAPYSATATTETTQTLSDGNQIIRKNESKLYRDSEGRTRIEQSLGTIGKWAAGGEAQQHIFINDPVAGVSYSLDPRTRTADKIVTAPKAIPAGASGIIVDGQTKTFLIGGRTVTQAEYEAFAAAKEKKPRDQEERLAGSRKVAPDDSEFKKKIEALQAGKTDAGQRKTESLGTQTIEGVTAEGTRATLTIPAGEVGNTLPIEIVDETWYSPELQITVMTKHRDPRSGETTYRLTNLSRSEPDRSLFEVPADYIVRENKMLPKGKPPIKEEQ